MHSASHLLETLAPLPRLALAYAPGQARAAWLAFFALDSRLASVVRDAREPMIGQIRLAWWRDRLGEASSAWPAGEPLLALLREWDDQHGAFVPLVDGWEVLLREPPLAAASFLEAASGRAAGIVAVTERLGFRQHKPQVTELAQAWALADFAGNVTDPEEVTTLSALLAERRLRPRALPKALRPLVLLHGLSRSDRSGLGQVLTALRLGMLGR